ncbi:MAG TPA: MBL fold metallo-hydrolase [Pyrinomonadaceae bacterium]|jgi:glyoxylase-like metal-dependent hydrolase (beta-lactamase superfamily II)/ferredoxin
MATPAKRLPENAPGDFYVDASCIDCDACRQIAPDTFRDHGDQSSVLRQPASDGEVRRALMALVACPTASIGTSRRYDANLGVEAFPDPVAENVYFCGFTSESSFGAWSYLVTRPAAGGGNVLVDSPRYTARLVNKIERMGGVSRMFLTHVDDIADHARFNKKFSCERVMHARDGAERRGMERAVEGDDPVRLDDDLTVIPTPGHTRGSQVLLYKNRFLFTGDHLAWSPARETLTAFRSACWYSWDEQIRSMERLLDYSFEWVLPGHGRIHHDTPAGMRAHLARCVEWMKKAA